MELAIGSGKSNSLKSQILNIKKGPSLTTLILVSDEILYQAALHPETYTNTLVPAQISRLYKSLIDVTGLAVGTLADDTKFPESWLYKHRWNKGKKDIADALPNGGKVSYLTVGGRTTAIVASVQKKTDEREEKLDENGKREKEDEEEGEVAIDVEEKRAKGKRGSEGGKKTNQEVEALPLEPTIAGAKHHPSEKAKRKPKLPPAAKQDEEESQSDDMPETAAADSKAGNPTGKPNRKLKPAPGVEQGGEAEPQPAPKPTLRTPTPTTKTAKQPKPKLPTGTKQENEELRSLANLPTRKSTRKSNPPILATPTIPRPPSTSSLAPLKPKKKNNNSPPTARAVHPSSSKTQKRKINPSTEEGDLPESPNNTAEETVNTTPVSKKIKKTMRTSLHPQEDVELGSSSSYSIVAKGWDEDIWEGRRRSRRVSGRGVTPVGMGERKVI